MKKIILSLVPGGNKPISVDPDWTVSDLVAEYDSELAGRTITLDNEQIDPKDYDSTRIGSTSQIYGAKPTKGN